MLLIQGVPTHAISNCICGCRSRSRPFHAQRVRYNLDAESRYAGSATQIAALHGHMNAVEALIDTGPNANANIEGRPTIPRIIFNKYPPVAAKNALTNIKMKGMYTIGTVYHRRGSGLASPKLNFEFRASLKSK